MSFMAWNDRLMLGVKEIDDDHKRLVQMLNELYSAISAGAGNAVVANLLGRLEQYTDEHFTREEALFSRTAYPDADLHRSEHAKMRAWVADMQRARREGTLGAPALQLITGLKDWLFDHILVRDQQLLPHLRAAGLA